MNYSTDKSLCQYINKKSLTQGQGNMLYLKNKPYRKDLHVRRKHIKMSQKGIAVYVIDVLGLLGFKSLKGKLCNFFCRNVLCFNAVNNILEVTRGAFVKLGFLMETFKSNV